MGKDNKKELAGDTDKVTEEAFTVLLETLMKGEDWNTVRLAVKLILESRYWDKDDDWMIGMEGDAVQLLTRHRGFQ